MPSQPCGPPRAHRAAAAPKPSVLQLGSQPRADKLALGKPTAGPTRGHPQAWGTTLSQPLKIFPTVNPRRPSLPTGNLELEEPPSANRRLLTPTANLSLAITKQRSFPAVPCRLTDPGQEDSPLISFQPTAPRETGPSGSTNLQLCGAFTEVSAPTGEEPDSQLPQSQAHQRSTFPSP